MPLAQPRTPSDNALIKHNIFWLLLLIPVIAFFRFVVLISYLVFEWIRFILRRSRWQRL